MSFLSGKFILSLIRLGVNSPVLGARHPSCSECRVAILSATGCTTMKRSNRKISLPCIVLVWASAGLWRTSEEPRRESSQ